MYKVIQGVILTIGGISIVYAFDRNNRSIKSYSLTMMSKQNAGIQSNESFNNMINIMQNNGFNDEANAMKNRDFNTMNKLMTNISESDYNKMITIMQNNGYVYMVNMLQSTSRENMIKSYGGMMERQ